MSFVNTTKFILALFGVVIVTTGGYGVYWLGGLGSDVKHHTEAIADLKLAQQKTVDEIGKPTFA